MGLYFHVKSVKSETEKALCCILTDGDKVQWIPRSIINAKIAQDDMTFKVYIRNIPSDKRGKLADLFQNDFLYEDDSEEVVKEKREVKKVESRPGRFIEPGAPKAEPIPKPEKLAKREEIPKKIELPPSVDPGFDSIAIQTEPFPTPKPSNPNSTLNQDEGHSMNEILELMQSIKVREERLANEIQNLKTVPKSQEITLKVEISEETRCFLGGFMQLGTQLVTRLNQLCLMMDTSSLEPQVPAEKSQPVINK
jgi:hypothetical protein